MNKYELRKSLEWLCDCFKRHPHYLEDMLKECTIEVDIKYDGYYTITEEVNNLDDVVQCILKYK